MSKKVFVLSIILMSLSLIGIIFVQAYFINDAYQNEKARFKFNVKSALSYVSNAIEQKELDRYFERFQELDSEKKKDSAEVSRLFIYQRNNSTKDMLIYKSDVLEENYKLSSSLFDIGLDSIDIKRIIGNSEMQVVDGSEFSDEDIGESPILKIVNSGVLKDAERNSFNKNFKAFAKTIPVHKRVSREEVADLLSTKFKQNGIDIDFEFAIYSRDLATKVYSEGFEKTQESTFSIPVFYDENNQSNYKLLVNFPKDGKFIFSTILGMVLLSIVFTSIIIIAYSSALFQLIRQRKISQIKTDL